MTFAKNFQHYLQRAYCQCFGYLSLSLYVFLMVLPICLSAYILWESGASNRPTVIYGMTIYQYLEMTAVTMAAALYGAFGSLASVSFIEGVNEEKAEKMMTCMYLGMIDICLVTIIGTMAAILDYWGLSMFISVWLGIYITILGSATQIFLKILEEQMETKYGDIPNKPAIKRETQKDRNMVMYSEISAEGDKIVNISKWKSGQNSEEV